MHINRFKTIKHNNTHKIPLVRHLYKVKISVIFAVLAISSVSSLVGSRTVQAVDSTTTLKSDLTVKGSAASARYINVSSIQFGASGTWHSEDKDDENVLSFYGLSRDALNSYLKSQVAGQYYDDNPSDGEHEWVRKQSDGNCTSKIRADKISGTSDVLIKMDVQFHIPGTDGCKDLNPNSKILLPYYMYGTDGTQHRNSSDTSGSRGWAHVGLRDMYKTHYAFAQTSRTDANDISKKPPVAFKQSDPAQAVTFMNPDDETDKISIPQRPVSNSDVVGKCGEFYTQKDIFCIGSGSPVIGSDDWEIGHYKGKITLVSGSSSEESETAPDPDDTGGSSSGGGPDQSALCDMVQNKGFLQNLAHPIQWFTCAIASTLSNWVDDAVVLVAKTLCFDPINEGSCNSPSVTPVDPTSVNNPVNEGQDTIYGDGSGNIQYNGDAGSYDTLRTGWNSFRNMANAIFVIALLVVIISEALGIGLLDAYAVKKMLPKLVIAIILCNLSYDICGIVIQFVNTVGVNMSHIMMQPFGGSESVAKGIQAAAGNTTGSGTIISGAFSYIIIIGLGYAIFAIVASGGLGLAPVLIFLLSLFMGALMAFIMLLVREIALIGLIMFSPFAFAVWVLPGGDKWLGKWWKTFIELMLMFPIIMGMLAIGQIVAIILGITHTTGSNIGINGIIALIAMILPFFLIPATFKMSVSSLNGVSNFLSSKGKGIMDKGKNWRDNNSQWGWRKGMKQMARKSARDRKGLGSLQGDGIRSNLRRRAVTGAKTNRGLNSPANRAILGNMQAQQEKAEYDESLAGLQHDTHNMGRSAMLNHLQGVATGSSGATETQQRAAITMLTQQKAARQLQDVQEHMRASGNQNTWNRAMAENYGDLQSAMPYLATELTEGMTEDELRQARLNKVRGLSDEAIAGMHDTAWEALTEDYGSDGRNLAQEKYNRIMGPDPDNPANPRLAGQIAQSTKARFSPGGAANLIEYGPPAPAGGGNATNHPVGAGGAAGNPVGSNGPASGPVYGPPAPAKPTVIVAPTTTTGGAGPGGSTPTTTHRPTALGGVTTPTTTGSHRTYSADKTTPIGGGISFNPHKERDPNSVSTEGWTERPSGLITPPDKK